MRIRICIVFFLFSFQWVSAQVVTVTNPANTTPALAATYTSLANAISALNGITAIAGPVIITLNPGNPQTTPAGGYTINFTAATTAANYVRINGSGNTITAFTPQPSGSYIDALFKIIGSDYLTLENFIMRENPANTVIAISTNNMTEWGVALLVNGKTNGAQHNTIQNNQISLNRNYPNTFGIYLNSSHTPTAVGSDGQVTNGTTAPNHYNKIYGNSISNVNMGITLIGSSNSDYMDVGNDIGGSASSTGNTITNFGGKAQSATFFYNSGTVYGIFSNHQRDENISYNTIESATLTGTVPSRGIYKQYSKFNPAAAAVVTTHIEHNTISINNQNTGGAFELIRSEGQTGDLPNFTLHINNNELVNNVAQTVVMNGIYNTVRYGALNINSNYFHNNYQSAATGTFNGIYNTVNIPGTININNNRFGDNTDPAFYFTAATVGGTVNAINCTTTGSNFSINNNEFSGFVFNNAATAATNYINFTNAPTTATTGSTNNNIFRDVTIVSTGITKFISRTGVLGAGAGATEITDKNKFGDNIFINPGAGNVYGYFGSGNSNPGNSFIITGNEFFDWSGQASVVMAISSADGTNALFPTKLINDNSIHNWTFTGSSVITPILGRSLSNNSQVINNKIEDITTENSIIAIDINTLASTGNVDIVNNTIKNIDCETGFTGVSATTTSTGSFGYSASRNKITQIDCSNPSTNAQISGLYVSGASGGLIEKNIIGNIEVTGTAFILSGIRLACVSNDSYTVRNNVVGKLFAYNADNPNSIRGIYLQEGGGSNSFYYVYHNTVYLDATGGGTNFGSCALFSQGVNNATTQSVTLQNNLLVNISTSNGTGVTTAYYRFGASFTNLNNTSNNNIFYAGIPGSQNLIFSNGSNNDQLITDYQLRVAPAESASQTELPPFLSFDPSLPSFLHINASIPTRTESGGMAGTGVNEDIDSDIRQGFPGYIGTGTAPDIGADEFEGILTEFDPPIITYTVIASPTCTSSGMVLTPVNIIDATGIPLTGANIPRIYYHKNSDPWHSQAGTFLSGIATNSNWSFAINEVDMGGVAGGDIVEYFVIAQDVSPAVNTGSSPGTGLVATNVHTVSNPPAPANSYLVNYALIGTYTVGTGGNFTTLTQAINVYNNACALLGNVIFELTDNSYTTPAETFPVTILERGDAGPAKTLTIRPATTATPQVTGNNTSQIILYDGADYVYFDGRQGGAGTSKNLTLRNEGTGVTIQFMNDAQNNIIRYSNIQGRRPSSFSGIIFFGTASPTGTGNDNNLIEYNALSPSTDFSTNGIYSAGTAGKGNDNIEISNNLISDLFNPSSDIHGIYVNNSGTGSNWNIHHNKIFQTAPRLFNLSGNRLAFGIRINTGSGHTISDNVIGFENENSTGSTILIGNDASLPGFPTSYTYTGIATNFRFIGISGDFETGAKSNIDGNIIGGIALLSASNSAPLGLFTGIYIESGPVDIGKNKGNTIGSETDISSIYIANASTTNAEAAGIRVTTSGTCEISNNNIGGILISGITNTNTANFTGISAAGSTQYNIHHNTIGNSQTNNLRLGYAISGGQLSSTGNLQVTAEASSNTLTGIYASPSGNNTLTINDNTFQQWELSQRLTEIKAVRTQNPFLASSSIVTINNNHLGTPTTPWLRFAEPSNMALKGIDIASICRRVIANNNYFTGISYAKTNVQPGVQFIYANPSFSFGDSCSTSNNTFHQLSTQELNTVFIELAYSMSNNFSTYIRNNKTTGSSSFAGSFIGIKATNSAVSGANFLMDQNNFTNILSTGDAYMLFDQLNNGANNSPKRKILNNTFSNISVANGKLTGLYFNTLGNNSNTLTDSISLNTLQQLSTVNGNVQGLYINKYATSVSGAAVTGNNINQLSGSGTNCDVAGIYANIPTGTTGSFISNNTIHTLNNSSAGKRSVAVWLDNNSSNVTLNANKIYNINHAGVLGYVSALRVGETGAANINNIKLYNNLAGLLAAPNAGDAGAPVVIGIDIFNNGASEQIDVVNNTIYLNATGSHNNFSTAGIYTAPIGNVTVENNIVVNTSTPGLTGKTVAHWRGGSFSSGLTGFANDYYVGATASNKVTGFDGTNSYITLADYKTNFGADEQNSVAVMPVFLSVIGANSNFLHLQPTSNCNLMGIATNDHHLLPADFDNDLRDLPPPAGSIISIGADEVGKTNTWTGANGTSWNDAGNWSTGIVPNNFTENIVINIPPPANQPIISTGESFQINHLTVSSGALLTNHGTLKVSGHIKSTVGGISNVNGASVEGSVEFNTFCNITQEIDGSVFAGNKINDLTISSNATLSSNVGEGLNIHGALLFGIVSSKTFNTGDNLTLVSNESNTARVGKIINSNKITGKAIVERYINSGLPADGRHIKSWQFLSTPVLPGTSVFESWQESGATPAGYGTIITGTGIGFDITTAQPSMKWYDETLGVNGDWQGISNTAQAITEPRGYMVFVRGDRTVTSFSSSANPTTMRIKGPIYQPATPPATVNVPAGKLMSVGNPYASAIDIHYMLANGHFTNLNNDVIVWDPLLAGSYNLGGYQTLSAVNNYEPTAGGTAYYPSGVQVSSLQSGQAFFVKSSGAAGQVSFSENCKTDDYRLVNRNMLPNDRSFLRAKLFTDNDVICDGNAAVFSTYFSKEIDENDAIKMKNSGENFSISINRELFTVEARTLPNESDTIFYSLSGLKQQAYKLKFFPESLRARRVNAYLHDRYLGTETQVSLSDVTEISFRINADSRSQEANRFYLVFKRRRIQPVPPQSEISYLQKIKPSAISFKLINNPVTDNALHLRFAGLNPGKYTMHIFDLSGRKTASLEIFSAGKMEQIKVVKIPTNLSAGIYVLQLITETQQPVRIQFLVK